MARLEIIDLTHRFSDGPWGLTGVNLRLEPGTLTVLTGANGCGKSLLLKHLVGLERAQGGEILLDGEPVEKNWNRTRGRVGLVFQEADHQIIEATVVEDAAFGPRQMGLGKKESREKALEVLKLCRLEHRAEALCMSLSGGEKRRLTLAGVLALDAEVLLLDEPFTGLDLEGTRTLLRILMDLKAQGRTLLVVTHELEKCLAHAEHLALMGQGQILAQGSPPDVWEQIPAAGVHRPPVSQDEWRKLSWLAP